MPTLSRGLVDVTRKLLCERPRGLTFQRIEADTGLTAQWLYTYAAGISDDPTCSRVQTLYEYLTNTKLEIVKLTA